MQRGGKLTGGKQGGKRGKDDKGDVEDDEDDENEEDDEKLFGGGGGTFATRKIGKTGKGKNRRLGKGKRCSDEADDR